MRIGNEERHTEGLSQVVAFRTTLEHGTSRLKENRWPRCPNRKTKSLETVERKHSRAERERIYTRTLQMHVSSYVIRLQVLSFKRGDF